MSTIELPPPAARDAGHFVSTEPFDPGSAARLTPEQERFYLASQWKLMWWKFKLHRVAVVSGIVLLLMYGSTLVTEILAPYNLQTRNTDFIYASPQEVHLFHDGRLSDPCSAKNARYGHVAAPIPEDKSRRIRCASSASATRIASGASSTCQSTSFAPRPARRCSSSAPTALAGTCCRASSTVRGSR